MVVNEVKNLCLQLKKQPLKVLVVGVIGNFIYLLNKEGYKVTATDFYSSVVGCSIHGVYVENGSKTLELIEYSDIAIVTGMTLATETIDNIILAAKKSGTRLIFYCETGANLSSEYCSLGVDVVISERFPFYVFNGESIIDIYRNFSFHSE